MIGRFDTAREHLEEARFGRRQWREPATLAMDWAHHAAAVESLAADPAAAERVLIEACETVRELRDRPWLAIHLGALATAVVDQGRLDEGLAFAKEASTLALPDDHIAQVLWRRARARALAASGKHAPAERLAREAVAIRDGTDLLNERAESLLVLAEVLGMRKKAAEAADALGQALTLFEAKGNTVAVARARASLPANAG
jgi:tetratricopeptide (TPR) repeat protein